MHFTVWQLMLDRVTEPYDWLEPTSEDEANSETISSYVVLLVDKFTLWQNGNEM